MAGLSKGEIAEVVESLRRQGARIEGKKVRGGGNGNQPGAQLRFPIRIYPPNGGESFTLHQTTGDVAQMRILDTQIRRAGMESPLPPSLSRKEKSMSIPNPASRTPGEHLVEPPGRKARKYPPTQSSVDNFKSVLPGLPDEFWTDVVLTRLNDRQIPGYSASTKSGGAAMQRVQGMLDWLGYRVIEVRKNRGGYSYKWFRDPLAEERAGVEQNPVANLGKREQQPAPQVEFSEQPSTLQADAGPIAAAMAEAERRKAEKAKAAPAPKVVEVTVDEPEVTAAGLTNEGHEALKKSKHERRQCAECQRWFTPEGLEHHEENTGHNQPKPDAVTPGVTEQVDLAEFTSGLADTATETVLTDKETFERNFVPRSDYDALEQMATEAESRASEANALVQRQDQQLQDAKTIIESQADLIADLERKLAESEAVRVQLGQAAAAAQRNEDNANAQLEQALAKILELEDREPLDSATDDSWVVPFPSGGYVQEVVDAAQLLGVEVSLRARRAK